jgi:sulfite exporter TauE/SafE
MNGWLEAILTAALLAGLMGGVHCAAMCGGIVGAVCGRRADAAAPRWRYALAYNAGRVASYAFAGMLAGALGQTALALRGGVVAQQLMLAAAGGAMIILALYMAGVTVVMRTVESAGSVVWRRIQPHTRWFLPVNSTPRAFGLGLLWGWLPCGMVYAVLLTALATGDAFHGALVMLAYGAGTLPNLLALALFFDRLRAWSRARAVRFAGGALIGVVGVLAILKAVQPAAASGDALLCHAVPGLLSLFGSR